MPDDQRPASTRRFSDRVENYVRYRPGYPAAVLDILRAEVGLTSDSVIADIGSGTGLSSELFLTNGNHVFGIEPNAEMRSAADALLATHTSFVSVDGTAEATTLPDASVDYIVAGQAFHWFDPPQAKKEFTRILRPGGWVVLLWNSRRDDTTSFLKEYENLLLRFGTDYGEVQHRNISPALLREFFGGVYESHSVYNEQRFDFEGLKGRLLSSSYTPAPGHPSYAPMLVELERIYDQHRTGDGVRFEYDTGIYFGHLA